MFAMFAVGMVVGAALLACFLQIISEKPNPFKLAIFLIMFAVLASEWAIAARDTKFDQQYQHLSGGKGDGL